MSDPTWDTVKENFQPLRKGRDPKRMDDANNMQHGERAQKIKDERRYVSAAISFVIVVLYPLVTIAKKSQKKRVTGRFLVFLTLEWNPPPHISSSVLDSAFWQAIADYEGDDPLEVWVR